MRLRAFALTLASLARATAHADPVDDALSARCTRDARLATAAAHALADPRGFDARELQERAWSQGLPAPSVHALVLRGGDPQSTGDAVARWLGRYAVSTSLSRCAVTASGGTLAVALAPRVVDVAPAPCAGPAQAWRVALPEGVTASLVASSTRGDVRRAAIAADGSTSLTLDARGDWTLQVLGALPSGPAPLATWTERIGARDGARSTHDAPELWSARQLLGAINALRSAADVAPLRRDPMLDRVAEQHAERLSLAGVLAHTLQPGETPVERLRLAGVVTTRVAENLARGHTLTEAHAGLSRSPSHRANLLDAEVDAVGVGVARAQGVIYLVELFAARPAMSAAGARAE